MDLKLSELEGTASEAIITVWHVSEGDRVERDQDILEVVTDKATFDVPAPAGGVVTEIIKKEGETVKVDEIIARIEEDGDNA